MLDTLQQFFADAGYLALPAVFQIVSGITAVYTAYRTAFYGTPSVYHGACKVGASVVAWMKKPSRVELLRREVEALKRDLGTSRPLLQG